jgi:hypothetical protein
VRALVRFAHLGRDTATVADRIAVALCPGTDGGELSARVATRPTRSRTAARAGHRATGGDERGESGAQALGVRRRKVDLVLAAFKGETDGRAVAIFENRAVEIVDELGDLLLQFVPAICVVPDPGISLRPESRYKKNCPQAITNADAESPCDSAEYWGTPMGTAATPLRGTSEPAPWGPKSHTSKRRETARRRSLSVCVGVTGFEPAASSSRTTRATKLRHTPLLRLARQPVKDSRREPG